MDFGERFDVPFDTPRAVSGSAEQFGPESFDPELKTEGLTAEGLTVEAPVEPLSRAVESFTVHGAWCMILAEPVSTLGSLPEP
ncbi:MAG: hypothetical protein ACREI5_05450 [Candidatus Methylomirabilales bacterium]